MSKEVHEGMTVGDYLPFFGLPPRRPFFTEDFFFLGEVLDPRAAPAFEIVLKGSEQFLTSPIAKACICFLVRLILTPFKVKITYR